MLRSRRIIFHIGAPKTGTSAIQRFLGSNTGSLRAQGLDYLNSEHARGDLHTTGNGLPIFLYFERAEADPEKLGRLIERYFGTEAAAVVSSELLSALAAGAWRDLIAACAARNIAPSIISYVRNVYPFYVSSYNQCVKHNGATDSFDEFVERNCVFGCVERLAFLAELIGAGRLHVAHYESHRERLCQHFLTLIAPGADKRDFAFHGARVNRSLDEAELRLMRIANRFPKAHFPGELPNILIASDRNRPTERPLRPGVIQLLAARHAADVAAINTTYFGGSNTLRISDDCPDHDDLRLKQSKIIVIDLSGPGRDAGGKPGPTFPHPALYAGAASEAAATAPAEQLFEWAMSRLESVRCENFQQFLDEARALAARSSKAAHPGVPPDFDPASYLMANPDLLLARVDPCRHFVDHGRKEGRSWRIDGEPTRLSTRRLGVWTRWSSHLACVLRAQTRRLTARRWRTNAPPPT